MKLFSLEGKVALVTGASRGLGRVIAGAMAEAGAHVILAARDKQKLEEAVQAIRQAGGPNAQAPIIALTANALGHHREAWEPVGVAGFLTKPINPELLVQTLIEATASRPPCLARSEAA